MRKSHGIREGDGTRIEVPDSDDTYLEAMSGKESATTESQQTTCKVCGLGARTTEELQDHIRHAHKGNRD